MLSQDTHGQWQFLMSAGDSVLRGTLLHEPRLVDGEMRPCVALEWSTQRIVMTVDEARVLMNGLLELRMASRMGSGVTMTFGDPDLMGILKRHSEG